MHLFGPKNSCLKMCQNGPTTLRAKVDS